MEARDFLALTPLLIVTGTALFVLMLDLFLREERRGWLSGLSLLGVVAAFLANLSLPTFREPLVQGMIRFDALTQFLNAVFLLGCGLAVMLSADYARRQGMARGEYYCLVLLSTLGAMLMGASADLLMLFLGLETLSIPLYVLATFTRRNPASQEAGLKYFLLGAFSSALFLYGIALLYGATGTTKLDGVLQGLSSAMGTAPGLVLGGLGLLLVGLAFKAAAVPFHTWAPDVYEGAPTSVTAFMAVAAKAGAFAAFLRVLAISTPALAEGWALVVGWLAVLTMALGNVVAVVQLNLKRLLAYSSIAHAGYLLIAVAVGQTGALSEPASAGLLFYLLVYTLMTLGAFGVVIVAEGRGENLSLEDMKGLAWRYPWVGLAMALFMVSLAGLPPTAGFFAKFYVFRAAVEAGSWGVLLAIVGVIASVISVFYYLRVVYYLYLRPAPAPVAAAATEGEGEEEPGRPVYLSRLAAWGLGIAAVSVLFLGVYPTAALRWLVEIAAAAMSALP